MPPKQAKKHVKAKETLKAPPQGGKSKKPLRLEVDISKRTLVSTAPDRLFDSMAQAAAGMGEPIEALKWAKSDGCPAFKAGGRVREGLLRTWLNEHPFVPSDLPAKPKLKDIEQEEKNRKLKIQNDKAEGILVDRFKLLAEAAPSIEKFKSTLRQKLEREYPKEVAGKKIEVAQEKGRKLCDELCGILRGLLEQWEQ